MTVPGAGVGHKYEQGVAGPGRRPVSLYVAQCTVKTHLRAIYQKLGVASRSEALERALDLGLL
jgi:hypothetical protein